MELKAPRDVAASGVVVEAQLSKGLGAVATVILKRGVLRTGDPLVVGTEHGRVRVLRSGSGTTLTEAGPGQAVVVSGLKGLPAAGDELLVVGDEARASRMAAARSSRAEEFRRSQLTRMQAEARRQQQVLREQEYAR
jgi:translation initiation factor IF-2